MNWMVLLMLVIMIPVVIATMFTPYFTRKTESFGVSIPEKVYQQLEIKALRKQYVFIIGLFSIVLMVLFAVFASILSMNENMIGIMFSIMIVLYLVISFFVYLHFHRNMKVQKQAENWSEEKSQLVVVDTSFRNQRLTYSNLWFLIPFVMVIVTIIITFNAYDQIPNKIPMHYNFDGEVTDWANKSYRTVLLMPIMQVYLILIFLFVNTVIAKAKQQVSAENPEKSRKQNVTFRRRWSAFNIFTSIALTLLFSLTQFSYIYSIDQQLLTIAPIVIVIAIVACSLILSFTTGQGGSRVKISTGANGNMIDRDDDRYWKLGQFYFNKNDPAIFLEKRFGVGWTNNWAHPLSWIILLVIVGLAVGLPLILGS